MNAEIDKDFLTYLLLFAMHADYKCEETEREYILSQVDEETIKRVSRDFERHNDIQRIERIRYYLTEGQYSEIQLTHLVDEVVKMCKADGDYSGLEQSLMVGLKRILKT